ncbi:hypothetical protein MMC07_006598, partial [Pseudocyphellaria aurata]|nr:hypothetical protein [Pseudocyphellaria aurata]
MLPSMRAATERAAESAGHWHHVSFSFQPTPLAPEHALSHLHTFQPPSKRRRVLSTTGTFHSACCHAAKRLMLPSSVWPAHCNSTVRPTGAAERAEYAGESFGHQQFPFHATMPHSEAAGGERFSSHTKLSWMASMPEIIKWPLRDHSRSSAATLRPLPFWGLPGPGGTPRI